MNKIILFIFFSMLALAANCQTNPEPVDNTKTEEDEDRVFLKVEEEARFISSNEWKKFLEKNLKAEVPVDNDAPSGKYTCVVKFVVDVLGAISHVEAETKHGYGIEDEVIRVMKKSSGKWEPAMQNGRRVNSWHRQPVTFLVAEDGYMITTDEDYQLKVGDNDISVKADKIKPEDIEVTISSGTITKTADGKYTINIIAKERVIITLTNKKKNKKIGASIFDVK